MAIKTKVWNYFVLTLILLTVFGGVTFVQLTWIMPAHEGRATESLIESSLGNQRKEELRLRVLFYLNLVSLDGETLSEPELREICRISSKNKTLKYMEISNYHLKQDLLNDLKAQFGLEFVVIP